MLTPMETRYEGCLFRSRLEARWAVFFDVWGLKWRYEPDSFVLPSGRAYLPDFFLDGIGYVECKPSKDMDDGKLAELTGMLIPERVHGYLIQCDVPPPSEISAWGLEWPSVRDGIVHGLDDADYWFAQCPTCGQKGITYQGRSSRLGCPCCTGVPDRTWNERAVTAMRVAAVAARSMRFETLSLMA